MNINDNKVIHNLNKLIITNRLNRIQILQLVTLVDISSDINDLIDNFEWELSSIKH